MLDEPVITPPAVFEPMGKWVTSTSSKFCTCEEPLPFSASCGNALQAARRTAHTHPLGRTSQPRCWLHHLSPPAVAMCCKQLAAPAILHPRAGSRSRDADCITSLHQLWQCVAGSLPHILITILQAGSHSRDAGWITFSANCDNALWQLAAPFMLHSSDRKSHSRC